MEFTTSDGNIISEKEVFKVMSLTIQDLKHYNQSLVVIWEKEFLEWFLNKKIKKPDETPVIKLYEDITENELKQLEQLEDYLEL